MSAEVVANMLGVPLLKMNMSKVMNRLVGESEKKISQALRVAEANAPCVLLMDEVEKMLGGARSSNQSDSGTTNRVVAECLDFLQRDNGVMTVMTCNDATQLSGPEFARSDRVDVHWYFALPTYEERKEIFRVHLNKTGKEVTEELIVAGAQNSEDFTGAEIRTVIRFALRKAFMRYKNEGGDGNITEEDIIESTKDVIPLYKSSREDIARLEQWAQGRARFANSDARRKEHKENVDDDLVDALLEV